MADKPTTVTRYLASLPKERRDALNAVRTVIKKNLGAGYKEGIQYGMIGYFVPHSVYPAGYHCDPSQPLPFIGLGSQKNHMAVYLFCVYIADGEEERFRREWLKTGKKLDMGKSCVRFRKVEDVALVVIGDTVRRMPVKKFVAAYEAAVPASRRGKKKTSKKKATAKKTTKKKVEKKKAVRKS
jgi:uncharacterized protein DUF1801